MSETTRSRVGPDLRRGIEISDVGDGEVIFGHVGDSPVALVRDGETYRAFDAVCPHYGASLADGLTREGNIRCPWHHARFSLKDGSILSPPAMDPLPQRSVSARDGRVVVGDSLKGDPLRPVGTPARSPSSVIIIGGGAAGSTAAETLRREGYEGPVLVIDPEPEAPYDRPNLSKDYLAGDAPEEWIPLRSREFLDDHRIERLEERAARIETEAKEIVLQNGRRLPYGELLLATGSRPRTLPISGADMDHVYTLRSLEDCRRIIQAAEEAERAAIVGASFIGMEAAASLKGRGLEISVVAPEATPFEEVLGSELGSFLRSVHEDHGVTFHLNSTLEEIRPEGLSLADGSLVEADLVVLGVGVEPNVELARGAGLDVEDGIRVDQFLQTSVDHVYAAGDVARYPEPRLGKMVRIEHWVHAQRQGRTAARNILGHQEPFTDVPFFWTEQFGVPLAYVGHAEEWDEVEKNGDCGDAGCSFSFMKEGERVALATVYRDGESLRTEAKMEEAAAEEDAGEV
jgi:3-phenylpropionate/trans-cinnamate dioxygenase ferredoxin reductase subunit